MFAVLYIFFYLRIVKECLNAAFRLPRPEMRGHLSWRTPFGNRANRSLVETPDSGGNLAQSGRFPRVDRALAAKLDDLPMFGHQFGDAFFFGDRKRRCLYPIRSGWS